MRANRSRCRCALIGRWFGCVRGASGAEGYPGYLRLAVAHAQPLSAEHGACAAVCGCQTQQGSSICTVGSTVMCTCGPDPWSSASTVMVRHARAACTLHTAGGSACAHARVSGSVLIDSEPRSCRHAVDVLAHTRQHSHSDGRPNRRMKRKGARARVHSPDAHGAYRALELRASVKLKRILTRLRGVRVLVREGALLCRTRPTQH